MEVKSQVDFRRDLDTGTETWRNMPDADQIIC